MNKYKADLFINKYKIEDELLEQPQKYYEYSQAAAEAEVERDYAKDAFDIALIDVEAEIRGTPEKFFDEDKNITEGAIKSALNSHPKVKRKRKLFQRARKNYNLLKKAEKAFEQRKRMLEAYLYYISKDKNSEVRVPKKQQERFNKRTKRDIQSQLGGIKRRKVE